MSDTLPSDRTTWLEAGIALSLSVAGLSTTWSGYQSALWDGEQAAHYSQANGLRIQSAEALSLAGQEASVDVTLFSAWLDAAGAEEPKLQAFYAQRFRPEFRPALEAWLATQPLKNPQAPPTPFVMPAYHLAARDRGEALQKQADKTFDQGQKDNEVSDFYVQATVILGSSLFFGGICQTFHGRKARLLLAILSGLACVAGILRTLTLPHLPLPLF